MNTELTIIERNDLQYHEQRIESWSDQTANAAESFREIRDGRLYRATHGTFEAYCKERWGHTRQHINRIINSAALLESQEMEPIGSKIQTESQARELAKVEPERRQEVVEKVVERDGKITARAIREEVMPQPDSGIPDSASWAMRYARLATDQLSKISTNDPKRKEAFEYVINYIKKEE